MTAGSTIREHLEQQIAELDYWLAQDRVGHLDLLRLLREHAVAALRILDEAERRDVWINGTNEYAEHRLVPDPVGGSDD